MEEFHPLHAAETVPLSRYGDGAIWSELGKTTTADALAVFADGPAAGSPAVTRNTFGGGVSYYVSTSLGAEGISRLVGEVAAAAGVGPVVADLPAGVEGVKRSKAGTSWLFVINHGADDVTVPVHGAELISGSAADGTLSVAGGGVAVVRLSN
jgi:beta-galactosidase